MFNLREPPILVEAVRDEMDLLDVLRAEVLYRSRCRRREGRGFLECGRKPVVTASYHAERMIPRVTSFVPAPAELQKSGLVAFIEAEYGLLLISCVIRTTRRGRLTLSFPARHDRDLPPLFGPPRMRVWSSSGSSSSQAS